MIRVDLYGRSNTFIQTLGGAKNAAYHAVLNQDGAGSFLVHRSDPIVLQLGMLTGGIDGYIVHLLRKGPLEQAFTDRFSFVVESVRAGFDDQEEEGAWIAVGGRGTLCLLEDRVAFPPGFDGVNPSTITAQWQTYVATAGGAIMDGEIDRSNGRFALQLTHSVQQSTIQQTVKLRFDNLRKLHDYLVSNGMDAQMVGLDYQARDRLGADKSSLVTVALGPQDSLIATGLDRDARPVKNWVIAQGTGEGINAPLAVASDATSIANLRRREGFLDTRQADAAAQLALGASSAVSQLKDPDQRITVRYFDSPKTQLYREVFLGDTITLDASILGLKAPYRVVGIQVADTDQEIEDVHLDLNSMRLEDLLKLQKGTALTADSLNVLNRMPQGGPFNDSFGWADSCDATHPFRFCIFIPSNVLKLNAGKLTFHLEAYRAYETGTAGGSAHSHSVSGQSTNAQTSGQSSGHTHALSGTSVGSNFAGNNPVHYDGVNNLLTTIGANGGPISSMVSAGEGTLHNHNVPSVGVTGATSSSESSHTHGINYGITEGATATGVTVKVNGIDRTSALGGGTGFTADQTELEVSQWLTIGAFNTIDLTPAGNGRIVAHVRLTGYIQSN